MLFISQLKVNRFLRDFSLQFYFLSEFFFKDCREKRCKIFLDFVLVQMSEMGLALDSRLKILHITRLRRFFNILMNRIIFSEQSGIFLIKLLSRGTPKCFTIASVL